ncbi:hypothetical protein BJ742DRAFT_742643 [Cladochytrium replicatum]|nr:hypothetical protein BJ742DRAFT_742643 [Cladochytrium replicatum]
MFMILTLSSRFVVVVVVNKLVERSALATTTAAQQHSSPSRNAFSLPPHPEQMTKQGRQKALDDVAKQLRWLQGDMELVLVESTGDDQKATAGDQAPEGVDPMSQASSSRGKKRTYQTWQSVYQNLSLMEIRDSHTSDGCLHFEKLVGNTFYRQFYVQIPDQRLSEARTPADSSSSIEFDKDDDYFAFAGVAKKINH